MKPGKIIFAAACWLFSHAVLAQLPLGKPLIRNFSISEYAGNSQNWAIRQGPDGLIYVGGGSSLLVYDGDAWRNINTRHDGRVRDLEIDEQGRIWVGSPSEFGYYQRGADGGLVYHSVSDMLPEADRAFGETRFVERIGESIYFNTHHRLFRWANGELITFDKWDGLFRLAFVAHGRYYVAVQDRLYDLTEFPVDGIAPEPEDRWRWPDKARITFFLPWDNGQLLLGTYDDGLYLLSNDKPRRFNNDSVLSASWPYKALRMADDGVVITTIKAGIIHLDAGGHLLDHISSQRGLAVNGTLGATVDQEGGLWLAQEGAIARVELNSSLRYYDGDSGVENPRDLIDHEGQLLVAGSMGVGLLHNGPEGLAQVVSLEVPLVQEGWDLLSTSDGLMVAGFQGVHLAQFDYQQKTTTGSERLFEDTYSYHLFPSQSRPAVYVESETGLGVLVRDENGWRALPKVVGIDERPETVAEQGQNRVWVGSGNGRYYRLRWRDPQTLELDAVLDSEQGVPEGNAHVFTLGERLIFGTTQGGYRLDEDGLLVPDPLFGNEQLGENPDVFRFFSPDQRRVVAVIGGISQTWTGELGSNGGIQWRGQQLQQLDQGFMSFFSQARGKLWFGRHPHLYYTDWPQNDYRPDYRPDHRADQRADSAPSVGAPLNLRRVSYPDRTPEQGMSRPQVLLAGTIGPQNQSPEPLPYSQDVLRFEYALASYRRADLNEYRVRLVGLEESWSPWTRETRRDYTNLPDGNYQFEVQGRNMDGVISASRGYRFSVRPPWYFAGPAWVVYAATALILLWLAVIFGRHQRQVRLMETQRRLESEVAERTSEVRAQARELRELNEARSRFFANVSHEFRTPLTLAKAPLEELARGDAGPLSDQAKSYVGMALRNTETMQGLIGQVLDMNRLEAGKMPISVTRDRIAPLVLEVADEFRSHARANGIDLNLEISDESVEADFDPGHLRKVIRNLLSNALKFTHTGGKVTVRCGSRKNNIEITVADTGPGILAKDRERIFERYYQGDQTQASQPGTGIGLALVRELMQLHQGDVELGSNAGPGAIFRVWFPNHLPELRGGPVAVDEDPGDAQPEGGSRFAALHGAEDDVPTVLIVDDNEELRSFLKMRLGGSYRVLEAEDGEAGLQMAREELPDVVVTDVMMPKMTGLEMTEAIKADPEIDFTPVLMLSARSTRRDTVAGLEQGADDYLSKPFDTAELATRVAGLIASRRRLRERLQRINVKPEASESAFLSRAREVVQGNLGESDFGPRDWAQLLHMDRTTLYRKLKSETGLSPEDYLREQRLLRAADLLERKAGNVSQVAVSVGFNSISYFSRRFRERFGTTPASYRKP